MAAQWWYGPAIHHEGRQNVIGCSGLKRQRLRVVGHSGKLLASTPRKSLWKQHSAARRQRLPMHIRLLQ